tara:strand:+ start:204 stop:311 length:108 start_codon:yes stop_codon:yes gene_type:complete
MNDAMKKYLSGKTKKELIEIIYQFHLEMKGWKRNE